jgi:L-asparaginase
MKKLRILLTGGTIDKTYDTRGGFQYTKSCIPEILQKSRITIPYTIEELLLKDSLNLSFSDRVLIRNVCENCEEQHIIIIHGTDTMVQSARAVSNVLDKVIVFTGSIIPYSVAGSDADFNIGTSVAYSQILPNGTYISMNGIAFPYYNVRKNMQTNLFEFVNQ